MANELYNLTMDEKDILLSEKAWLNDKIMDAAQKLICEICGHQSVLNSQNKGISFTPLW